MPGLAISAIALAAAWGGGNAESDPILVPTLVGEWWTVAHNPDLGLLGRPEQEPVDFALWQAADGTWQVLSCIRKTREAGRQRVFYRWEGKRLTDADWQPMGVAMRAEPLAGEIPGALQAPFVLRIDDRFHMFYGSGPFIASASGDDGKTYERNRNAAGSGMFGEPAGFYDSDHGYYLATHARDPMVLQVGDLFYCYYTANPDRIGSVYLRTSRDLNHWSPSKIVRHGGAAGTSGTSAECPFVVYHEESGYYYLLTTQRYGENALSSVYRSKRPDYFGIDEDEGYLVATIPVAAPEIVRHEGRYYIAALLPSLKGIQISRLEWRAAR